MKECYFYCSYDDSAIGYELTKVVFDNNDTLKQVKAENIPNWVINEISCSDSIVKLFAPEDSTDGAVLVRNIHKLVPDELGKRDKYISVLFIGNESECRQMTSYIIVKPLCFFKQIYSVVCPTLSVSDVSSSYIIKCDDLKKYIANFSKGNLLDLIKRNYNKKVFNAFKKNEYFDKYHENTVFMVSNHSDEYKNKSKLEKAVENFTVLKDDEVGTKLSLEIELHDIHLRAKHNNLKCPQCKNQCNK